LKSIKAGLKIMRGVDVFGPLIAASVKKASGFISQQDLHTPELAAARFLPGSSTTITKSAPKPSENREPIVLYAESRNFFQKTLRKVFLIRVYWGFEILLPGAPIFNRLLTTLIRRQIHI
jgi:hypothetical protein